MVDWDRGSYEDTGRELAPAAQYVVQRAGIEPGQEVLDLGTGTGNAAFYARQAGANVTAVDPSPRLLEVAASRVGEGDFRVAKAEDLPFDDASFDRVISIFAVIFSGEPEQAAHEIVRVTRGRALITAWESVGPMNDSLGILGRAASEVAQTPHRRFDWSNPDNVTGLFGANLAGVERATIDFEAPSAETYLQRFESRHPAGMMFRDVLTRAGTYDEVRERAKAALGTDEPLRVSSSYFIFTIEPRAAG
jgi:ubiquinone/menaquinone biosynthesis C-methylase UbiE